MAEAALLAAAWAVWCLLHSLLGWPAVQRRLEGRVSWLGRHYRLCYNLFALVTLLPLAWWELQRPTGPLLVHWHGAWQLLQGLGWLCATLLFYGGARIYPLREFIGIAPSGYDRGRLPPLVTNGVLGLVRHPWYLGVLLLLWSRDLDRDGVVTALVLSGYLAVGSRLEERRLERLYGAAYSDYMRRVGGLLPRPSQLLKWLRGK